MRQSTFVTVIFFSLLYGGNEDNSTVDAQKLYQKCAGCHGSDGKTVALNVSPMIAGNDKNATLTQLQSYQQGRLDTVGLGRLMSTQVNRLSPNELEALAEYISKMEK